MNNGISLIEILISLAILSLSFFSFSGMLGFFIEKNQAMGESLHIFQRLQLARIEAISRNTVVAVCPTLNNQQCSQDWSQGYMIFIPEEGKHQTTTTAKTVLHVEKNQQTVHVHSGKRSVIKFSSDGRCLTRGSIFVKHQKNRYRIVLSDSGRIRIEQSLR